LQALDLLRTGRLFARTAVQTTPKRFLFVPILRADAPGRVSPPLTPYLNDFFVLSHWHDPLEGEGEGDESSSASSVVRRDDADPLPVHISDEVIITADEQAERSPVAKVAHGWHTKQQDINHLARLSHQVQVDIDVTRYQMNIVSFLRMHRAVHDGVTPAATRHFGKLMRCLASLHSLDYVTPALVRLAAKKTYMHRIRITAPENERSMQWGSDLDAVAALLDGVGPEHVIDDVLNTVTVPI
ncbi:hypothetical protein E4U42_006636, partial [Claviceps africana]